MVTIEFDRTRVLRYDLEAIRDLENKMDGEPLGVIIGRLAQLGINALVMVLWAGLKHDDRALTPNLVQKRLEAYFKAGGTFSALGDGINAALGECGLFAPTAEADPLAPTPPATS